MNKLFLFSILFLVVIFVTGCAMKKSADTEVANTTTTNAAATNTTATNTTTANTTVQKGVNYIVTTNIPKTAREGVKDTAEPGFVPINPNYDFQKIPKTKGKIEWFKTGLGSKIPAFPEGNLLEVINTDKEFVAYIANVDEKTFSNYFTTLFNNGYTGHIPNWEGFTLVSPTIAVNLRYMQEPGSASTIRARLLKNAEEYEKLKKELNKTEEKKTEEKK